MNTPVQLKNTLTPVQMLLNDPNNDDITIYTFGAHPLHLLYRQSAQQLCLCQTAVMSGSVYYYTSGYTCIKNISTQNITRYPWDCSEQLYVSEVNKEYYIRGTVEPDRYQEIKHLGDLLYLTNLTVCVTDNAPPNYPRGWFKVWGTIQAEINPLLYASSNTTKDILDRKPSLKSFSPESTINIANFNGFYLSGNAPTE